MARFNRRTRTPRGQVSRWSVNNFKSLSAASIDMRKLSLIAGINSSGKSSLIQSLLLLAQSGDELILNGQLVRLGLASEVQREGQNSITIEWETQRHGDGRDPLVTRIQLRPSKVSKDSEFEVCEYSLREGARTLLLAQKNRIGKATIAKLRPYSPGGTILRIVKLNDRETVTPHFITFTGIYPQKIIVRVLQTESRAIVRDALSMAFAEKGTPDSLDSRYNLWRLATEYETQLSEDSQLKSFIESFDVVGAPDIDRNSLQREISGLFTDTYRPLDLADGFPHGPTYQNFFLPRHIFGIVAPIYRSVDILQAFLKSIRYVGPLREEPQVLSATGGRISAVPAGLRGEFSADLLSRSGQRPITYGPPPHVIHRGEIRIGENRDGSLLKAVGEWAKYLGIGQEVQIEEAGKLGRGLRVDVEGRVRDLTTIGVGASQLLPVLCVVLEAPPGSLVILEQPELHLHPAVQARLGDFFMFARPDIRLIVETHSEYLVTRVRRRVAEGHYQSSDVTVCFAEGTESGATKVRTIDVESTGNLESWPRGFFDTLDGDMFAIIAANRPASSKNHG